MARRSFTKRIFRFTASCLLLFIISTTGMVLALRFVSPLTSGLMMERRIEALFSAADYEHHYQWVPLKNIAPSMGVAVIAAEDQLFANHAGFDWKAIEKAAIYNQKNGQKKNGKMRGASTISQQTAKNLFLWSGRNWLRKGLETWFTVLIEVLWQKDRILEVYLNIVEFGDGIYGVEAASQSFFKKPARKLSASEAALLAAVLPNPHVYKASQPSAYVRSRQKWILLNMRRLGGQQYLDTLGE